MLGLFSALGRSLDADGWIMWYRLLSDLPLQSLDHAVARWLTQNDSGFPTIAAIRKLATEHQHGPVESHADALGALTAAIQQWSPAYNPDKFLAALPPLVRQTVESFGGARWAADLTVEGRPIWMAQFRKAYEVIAARAESDRRLPEMLRPRLRENQEFHVHKLAEKFGLPEPVLHEAEAFRKPE